RSSAPADAGVSAEAAVAASDRPTTMPPIEIWTTNGFCLRRLGVTEEAGGLSHRFLVRQGRGESGVEIDVLIPARTRADTARQAGCQPSAEFWRGQAESALLNHLWANAAVPHGSLVVGRVTGALVHAAMDASRVLRSPGRGSIAARTRFRALLRWLC